MNWNANVHSLHFLFLPTEPITAKSQPRFISETELHIFDKRNRCLLFDGDYEVTLPVLQNTAPARNQSPKKRSSWEELPQNDSVDEFGNITTDCFDNFSKLPTLKFRLSWTKDKCSTMVGRPLPITIQNDQYKSNKDAHLMNGSDKMLANGTNKKTAFVKLYDIASRIIYRFIYNNNSSQQTEACGKFFF